MFLVVIAVDVSLS